MFQDADITLPADDASPEHEHEALQDPAETSSSDYESQEQSEPEPVSTPAQPVSQKKPTPPPLPRRQIPAPPPVRRTSSQEIANMNMLHSSNAQLLVHRAERLRLGKALPARGEGHSVQTAAQALFAQFERIRAGQAAARPDIDWGNLAMQGCSNAQTCGPSLFSSMKIQCEVSRQRSCVQYNLGFQAPFVRSCGLF